MHSGKKDKKISKEFTGLHVINLDILEDFYLNKAAKEQKIGRVLTEKEAIDLLMELKKVEKFESIYVEGKKENVRAILGEHFNTFSPKKREEK